MKLKTYRGDIYIKTPKQGYINLSAKHVKGIGVENNIKYIIEQELKDQNKEAKTTNINGLYTWHMRNLYGSNNVEMDQVDTDNVIFQNGYFDTEFNWNKTTQIPFSPFQIQQEYKPNAKGSELVKRFFKEVSNNDKDKEQLLFEIIGSSLTPKNWSIFPVLFSQHSTSGKGTIIELIQKTIGYKLTGQIESKTWLGNHHNSFALSPIRNKLMAFVEELPQQLGNNSTETIKETADEKRFLSIERKGIDPERMLNTITLLATSNNPINIHNVDGAIKMRMIWIPLNMNKDKVKGNLFTKKEIKELFEQKNIDWIIKKGIEAIKLVASRETESKSRKGIFTNIEEDKEFWDTMANWSNTQEIITGDEILNHLIESKAEHIPLSVIKEAFNKYKLNNKENKMTIHRLYEDLLRYFSTQNLGNAKKCTINVKTNGKKTTQRVIKIDWNKEEEITDKDIDNIFNEPNNPWEEL